MADNPINNFPGLAPALTDVLGHDDPAGARPTSKGTFAQTLALALVSFPFTPDSIPFADATGKLTESSYITFDDTNKRLSIGNGNLLIGTNNTVIGANGGQAQAAYAIALGGDGPIAAGINSGVLAGTTNIASGLNSAVTGGTFSQTIGDNSFIGGSKSSVTSGLQSAAIAGDTNIANGLNSAALGGTLNTITVLGSQSIILGGTSNTISAPNSTVLFGNSNVVSGERAAAGGFKAESTLDATLMIQLEDIDALAFTSTLKNTMCVKAGNGIGLQTNAPNSGVTFGTDWAVKRTPQAVSAPSGNETIIGVTDTSIARTITLQTADAVAGRIYIIKDESGAAGTNNITIDTQGGETIDTLANVAITVDLGVLRVYSDGTNWFTF